MDGNANALHLKARMQAIEARINSLTKQALLLETPTLGHKSPRYAAWQNL